jgi:hypothetical protein
MIGRRSKYVRAHAVATPAAWRLPPRPVLVLIVAMLAGLAGVAWSERQVFFRVAQRAAAFDQYANGKGFLEIWPPAEGGVVWKLAESSAGPAIEADVDVPPFALRVAFAISNNSSRSSPEFPPSFRSAPSSTSARPNSSVCPILRPSGG